MLRRGRPSLRLYWWNDVPNFGDALSPVVTGWATGRKVVWAEPRRAECFAAGSVLFQSHRARRRWPFGPRPAIWGSGFISPFPVGFQDKVDIAALRGPLSAELMGMPETVPQGDPGILAVEAMGTPETREDWIGLVPHLSQIDDPQIAELAAREPAIKVIDVRRDPVEVCREQIARCAHVVSSSLHGLIVADSYGVQSTWLSPEGIHQSPELKFRDYAGGVGRDLGTPLSLDEVADRLGRLPQGKLEHAEGVARSKEALIGAMPERLKAVTARMEVAS